MGIFENVLVNVVEWRNGATVAEDDRRQHKHETLDQNHLNTVWLAKAEHTQHSTLESLRFHRYHQQRVDQQNRDHNKHYDYDAKEQA